MRIIAGAHRGLILAEVGEGDRTAHLRPTGDRVREGVFNVLAGGRFGDPIRGAQVLDLFAGTGALGLEALSRGAAGATFVDSGKVAIGLIRDNLRRARRGGEAKVIAKDATRLPPADGPPASLVFLDPPYGGQLGQAALTSALTGGWIAPEAVVVWEESAPQPTPPGFNLLDHRRYGESHITFLRRADQPAA